ncbi:MAG: hypothetical protein L0Y71_00550 [Gemmataceae bacterium]|nr:hypothetical protein [Gemmataceae bacterium]
MIRTLGILVAILGLTALAPSTASAFGGLRRSCGGCEVVACAPAPAPAPVEVKYEERTVTRYRPVTKEKEVTCFVNKMVPREVKCTVMVPYTIKEKRTVTVCVPVFHDVECKYTERVPRVVKEKITRTLTERRVHPYEDLVPVCRVVCTPCVDECGRCTTKCERITEMRKVTRHKIECVPVVREFEVSRVEWDCVEKVGVRKVCEMRREQREIEVSLVRCRPEEVTRTVYDCVPEKVTRKVTYCEMEPYQEVIRVPVCPPTTECCGSGCGGRMFGGLFRRGCH